MKTFDDIKLIDWYVDRQLNFIPAHFTACKDSMVTVESLDWIRNTLTGRFALGDYTNRVLYSLGHYPAFEDPSEASYYQLKWG